MVAFACLVVVAKNTLIAKRKDETVLVLMG